MLIMMCNKTLKSVCECKMLTLILTGLQKDIFLEVILVSSVSVHLKWTYSVCLYRDYVPCFSFQTLFRKPVLANQKWRQCERQTNGLIQCQSKWSNCESKTCIYPSSHPDQLYWAWTSKDKHFCEERLARCVCTHTDHIYPQTDDFLSATYFLVV